MLALISILVWQDIYSIPLYAILRFFATISADLLPKQYQHRPPHRRRRMHDRLLYRNSPLCRHQAPSLDILDPTARQDLDLVRAIRARGREYETGIHLWEQ